jgi:hypothetical protein
VLDGDGNARAASFETHDERSVDDSMITESTAVSRQRDGSLAPLRGCAHSHVNARRADVTLAAAALSSAAQRADTGP